MTNCESAGDAFAAGFGVNAGTMTFRVNPAHDAVLVKRQAANAGEFSRQQHSLIETSLALTISMKRNRNNYLGAVERLAVLRSIHRLPETGRDERVANKLP